MPSALSFLVPDWPVPANVRALTTLRQGGVSVAPWNSFNLGQHVGDDPAAVAANREMLRRQMAAQPVWLKQVHGTHCVDLAQRSLDAAQAIEADASITHERGLACTIMTADCLPVLLCDDSGAVVAAAHAGWRGLAAGVLENTVRAMDVAPVSLMAWLGPAIGPAAFEVGADVRDTFIEHDAAAVDAFVAGRDGRWWCDIYRLARQRLATAGVRRVASADFCTVRDRERFFSYRRDGVTGRMASCIWRE